MKKNKIVDTNILINFWCKDLPEFKTNISKASKIDKEYETNILGDTKTQYVLTPEVFSEFINKTSYYFFLASTFYKETLSEDENPYKIKQQWFKKFTSCEEVQKFANTLTPLFNQILIKHEWSEKEEFEILEFDKNLFLLNPAPVDFMIASRKKCGIATNDLKLQSIFEQND